MRPRFYCPSSCGVGRGRAPRSWRFPENRRDLRHADRWRLADFGLALGCLAFELLAGAVPFSTELNAANLVDEQDGGRLAWRIYKFHGSALVPPLSPDGGFQRQPAEPTDHRG